MPDHITQEPSINLPYIFIAELNRTTEMFIAVVKSSESSGSNFETKI